MCIFYSNKFRAIIALLVSLAPTSFAYAGATEQRVVELLAAPSSGMSSYNVRDINFSLTGKTVTTQNKKSKTESGSMVATYTLKTDAKNNIVQMDGRVTVSGDLATQSAFTIPVSVVIAGTTTPQTYIYVYPEYAAYLKSYLGSDELYQYQNTWVKIKQGQDFSKVPFDVVALRKDQSSIVWQSQNWFTAKSKTSGASKVYTLAIKPSQFLSNVKNILAMQGKSSTSLINEADLNKYLSNLSISLTETNKKLVSYVISSKASSVDTKTKGVTKNLSSNMTYSVKLSQTASLPAIPTQFNDLDIDQLLKKVVDQVQTNLRASVSASESQAGFAYSVPSGYTRTDEGKVSNAAVQVIDLNDTDAYRSRINVLIWASDATAADILKVKNDTDAFNIISKWYLTQDGHSFKRAYTKIFQGIPYVFREEVSTVDNRTLYLKTAYTVKNGLLYKIEFSDNVTSGAYEHILEDFLKSVSIKDLMVNTPETKLQFDVASSVSSALPYVMSQNSSTTAQNRTVLQAPSTYPKDMTALTFTVPPGYSQIYRSTDMIELRKNDAVTVPGGHGYDAIRIDLGQKAGVSYKTALFSMSSDAYAAESRRMIPGTDSVNFQVKTLGLNMFLMEDSSITFTPGGPARYFRFVSMLRKNYAMDDIIYEFQITSDRPITQNSSVIDSFLESIAVH